MSHHEAVAISNVETDVLIESNELLDLSRRLRSLGTPEGERASDNLLLARQYVDTAAAILTGPAREAARLMGGIEF